MFIRFVINTHDEGSGRRMGLFQAMADLQASGELAAHESELYDAIYAWFKAHLKVPTSFARASRPHAKKVGLSWFKDSATEHMAKIRQVAHVLESHGVEMVVLRTERPGYIVYEDDCQVVAEPFQETAT